MTSKRSHIELDPDYEDVSEVQNKRRRVLEEGAKEATKKKIVSIIKKQFDVEVSNKEAELLSISEKLEMARSMMDRLRACIVANFYGNANQQKSSKSADQVPMIHPTVRKFIGKAPPGTPALPSQCEVKQEAPEGEVKQSELVSERIGIVSTKGHRKPEETQSRGTEQPDSRTGRFKVKKRIIVGNVSKSIPADQRDENDQATHKWMVYVRGPKNSPSIDDFVKKVWFFLHPSYRPNDLVEVSQPPFHLTRRGWGEFPVRVQLHFKDHRNKKLDIVHNLKLDRTYTGLQTLGSETVVDIEIEKDIPKVKREKSSSAVKVKQEVGVEDSITMVPAQEAAVAMEIKTEPADDHDYGRSACLESNRTSSHSPANKQVVMNHVSSVSGTNIKLPHGPTAVTENVLFARNQVETVISPSIITTQPLTLIPVGQPLLQNPNLPKMYPVTPPKNNVVQLQAVSPGVNARVTSPSRNVILKGLGSLSASNVGGIKTVVGGMPNTLIQVSPTKSQNSKNNFMMPSQPVILTNMSGNQPRAQTGLLQTSPLSNLKVNKTVNQPANSNLIFLKCTDNQGKTYLIPQQVGSSVSPLSKGSSPGQIRVTSPVTQPVLLTSNVVNGKPDVRQSGVTSSQSQVNATSSVQNTKNIVTQSVKQSTENGPVLFIKPDNNLSKRLTNATLVKSNCVTPTTTLKLKSSSSVQFVQSVSQNQNLNILNLKSGKQTTVCSGNQNVVRGQLKVTSQGLIQVQGQLRPQQPKSQLNLVEQRVSVNGGLVPGSSQLVKTKPHPLILVPSGNKVDMLQGKGKSLLNKTVANLQVPQSNGSVIVMNQSDAVSKSSDVGKVVISPSGILSKSEQGKLIINKSKNLVVDSGGETSKVKQNNLSNHILIVPVSSKSAVSMDTKDQTSAKITSISKLDTATTNGKRTAGQLSLESHDKTLIVVPNDKSPKTTNCENTLGGKVMSSLLGSISNSPLGSKLNTNIRETPVTITSSDSKEKKIIVVNKEDTVESCNRNLSLLEDKKIMLDPKRKRPIKPVEVKERDSIAPLRLEDYPDLLSLIQAAVRRHPIVSATAVRHLHPYCARSSEEWLSWNIGKRRASEWQRASSVRRFLLPYLEHGQTFKGDSLWTVKQILTWCRLHAYSPHYIERPLHPTAIDLQAETSLPSDQQHRKFTSVTDSINILQEVTSLQDLTPAVECHSDEEIDIISTGTEKPRVKLKENVTVPFSDIEMLPLTEGAVFVENVTQEIGIKLVPAEVEPGYLGTVSHGMLYKAMELFMGDVLRETFALKVNMGRYPDALGVADVYSALNSLPITDFVTNKFLGVEESHGLTKIDR
ncbi:YEATS domain-containing protein 2-like isoform X2 [Mercenaria mercenaria]|uniref:YEATS domain-containing protein 2-like isoform X2 n=1 Tax=Mercenaria mercenaria TaxID=6596 RepID=UPI00234F55BE|nr:YEATS domain-containing protein 2-like isoform X2 [Mercenaria mercenaria]